MKSIIQKTLRFALPAAMALALFAGAQPAMAGYAFNTASGDCSTFAVANKSTNEGFGTPCITGTSITVRPGEQFVTRLFIHNSGNASAMDVYARMTGGEGRQSGSKTFTGAIMVNTSTVAKSGSATIRFTDDVNVTLDRLDFDTNQDGSSTISGSSIFSSAGRLVADEVFPDANDWAVIRATYSTTSIGGSTNNGAPDVITGGYSPSSEDVDRKTLEGSIDPNGDEACTYFEYSKQGSSTVYTTDEDCSDDSTDGTFDFEDDTISNLSDGTYDYRACGYNDNGEDCGSTRTFTIDTDSNSNENECEDGDDNDNDGDVDYPEDRGCTSYNDDSEDSDDNNSDELDVTTLSYTSLDESEGDITLRGDYDENNDGSARTYFEYRKDSSSTRTVSSGTYSSESRSFSLSLRDLSEGDYRYRACAENNSDEDCGEWKTFDINRDADNEDEDEDPTVETLGALFRDTTAATVDGHFSMNGCSGSTYFEYGTTRTSLNSRTTSISRSANASGSMAQFISGLTAGRTYYYRAVGTNCTGSDEGSVLSFTTLTGGNNGGGTIIRTIVTNTNIGGGARYLRLTIDNGRDSVVRNDELVYSVEWENITKTDLKNLVLEVSFPEGLQIISTEKGQLDRKANAVYVNIDELEALEKDDMVIRARVNGTFKDNDPITARAIMAFENPENKAQENAIAYDSDSYLANNSLLGASIFGLDFLPGTLAGWLFLILLLILIILIIRYATRREEHHHFYPGAGAAVPPVPGATTTVTTTTESDDYTPYRPTPKF